MNHDTSDGQFIENRYGGIRAMLYWSARRGEIRRAELDAALSNENALPHVFDIASGMVQITPQLAYALEDEYDISDRFWLNLPVMGD